MPNTSSGSVFALRMRRATIMSHHTHQRSHCTTKNFDITVVDPVSVWATLLSSERCYWRMRLRRLNNTPNGDIGRDTLHRLRQIQCIFLLLPGVVFTRFQVSHRRCKLCDPNSKCSHDNIVPLLCPLMHSHLSKHSAQVQLLKGLTWLSLMANRGSRLSWNLDCPA